MEDLKDMHMRIYVHNMEVDAMFDFINGRADYMPDYWLNGDLVPFSVSGGYVEVCVNFASYTHIRSIKEHQSPFDI
jgi:hypothetical protein